MLDLPGAVLENVRRILNEHVPGMEVWAYGSRVTEQSHPGSDLDLVVRNPSDLLQPVAGLNRLRTAFRESDIPILVDVFDWARMPQSFREEIEREHVAVQDGAARARTATS